MGIGSGLRKDRRHDPALGTSSARFENRGHRWSLFLRTSCVLRAPWFENRGYPCSRCRHCLASKQWHTGQEHVVCLEAGRGNTAWQASSGTRDGSLWCVLRGLGGVTVRSGWGEGCGFRAVASHGQSAQSFGANRVAVGASRDPFYCVFSGEANSGEGHSRRCSRECGAGTAGLGQPSFWGLAFAPTPGTRRSARSPTQSQVPDTVLERVLEFTFPVRGCNVGLPRPPSPKARSSPSTLPVGG